MSDDPTGIAPTVRAAGVGSTWRHFGLILGLGTVVWLLLLKFFFPGYLDPFVPYHSDHFASLGQSAEGYGLMRYVWYYPRPLGFVLCDLMGRLGTRGMLVPVFVLTLINAALLIRYIERLTDRFVSAFAITLFFILVFANPESYWSVKEDILAVFSLFCFLLIAHLWQTYLESGTRWNIGGIILLALLSSYIKETYFATLTVFFLVQALACPQRRRAAFVVAVATIFIAGLSLFYNAQRSPFINTQLPSTDIYFQNWSPMSIWLGYCHLLKFLIFPVPALLVVVALVLVGRSNRKALWIGLISLLFVVTTLFPHTLLPNHGEDLYAWLGAFFLFAPILLADAVIPRRGMPAVLAGIAALAMCAATLMEYTSSFSKGMVSWLRKQEESQRICLTSLPVMANIIKSGENVLVVGPSIPYVPFAAPGYIRKSFGGETRWTVVLPDTFRKLKKLTTQVVHASDVTTLAYDRIFVFTPNAKLAGSYSRQDAEAILEAGGFTQFRALPRSENAMAAAAVQSEVDSTGVVLRADPNPVPGGTAMGKTTITWSAGRGAVGDVYAGAPGSDRLFASGSKGSQDARWIKPGPTEFRLYRHSDHKLLAELTVTMLSSVPPAAGSPTATPVSQAGR